MTLASNVGGTPRRCLILANIRAGTLVRREFATQFQTRSRQVLSGNRDTSLPNEPPQILTSIAEAAATAGLEAHVEAVPPPERLGQVIRDSADAGFDIIVGIGGDGTIRTIAQHLVSTPLRLGIIPLGTANNFARSLGIPFSLAGALGVVASGIERPVDVGKLGSEYFLEAAGVGLFADVLHAFGSQEPRGHDLLKLLRIAVPLAWGTATRLLEITLDGQNIEQSAAMVSVANATYQAEGLAMAPGARMSDGKVDVVVVSARSRWQLLQFAVRLAQGRHLNLPFVTRYRAAIVEVREIGGNGSALPVHADDHIAAYTPVRIETMHGALRVIVPSEPVSASG